MPASISQRQRVLTALSPQDISAAKTGAFLDVSGCQRILAAITTAAIAAGKSVAVQLMQAQDAVGTNAKPLGAAVALAPAAAGGPVSGLVDAKIGDLDHTNGFTFVAVSLVSNNGAAVAGAAVLILGGNRFNP